MNTLPFNEKIVNRNKYGEEEDLFIRDKYLGMIMPDGNLFDSPTGHGFSAGRTSLQFFFNYLLEDKSQEECIEYLEKHRDNINRLMSHNDKFFLIPLIDWQIKYAKNNFDLDSAFMKKYVNMCRDVRNGGGYWDTADYVVQILNFDKVERIPQTITTARININERFYNYLLMDFKVKRCPAVVYNEDLGDFCYHRPNEFITDVIERELEDEIQLIKKYVPLSERPKYFK